MGLSTYAELKASIADYLARSDLTNAIPDFITLCEAKHNRNLFCVQMEKRSTASVDTASDEPEFITLPSDFQTMRRLRLSSIAGKPALEPMSPVEADQLRFNRGNVSGQPTNYAIIGTEIELVPTPDTAYTLELVYRANLTPLSDATASNWLFALAPDAYLYGALMEAAPYLKDDARIPVWAAGLKAAVDDLNRLSLKKTFGGGPLMMRTGGVNP